MIYAGADTFQVVQKQTATERVETRVSEASDQIPATTYTKHRGRRQVCS